MAIREHGYELFERFVRSRDRNDKVDLPLNQKRPEGYEIQPLESAYFGMFKKFVYRNHAEIEMVEIWRKI